MAPIQVSALLAQALAEDSNLELDWLWYAAQIYDIGELRYCLERALHINPQSEQEALLGDSVGLALLVVLDSLTPAERVAFVLHDVFAVPFVEIAPIVGRTPAAARQLASRARRRVQGAPVPDVDLDSQWAVVDAFRAAARAGDFERLLAVLDPEVVLRSDGGVARPDLSALVRGARAVAERAMAFRHLGETSTRILVNGIPDAVA